MLDFPIPKATSAIPEYTVSSISLALKNVVESTFTTVRVRGEISGFKVVGSGHTYFNLKDENAVLMCACWKGVASTIPFKLEDGLEVICTGKLSTFPARSTYQLIISSVEIAGVGALLALLEKRKKLLEAEGLFDPALKKPLPFLPKCIGIVTSLTGAVIRDILHRVQDRFGVHILIWPTLVQGYGAAEQIADAIKGFNHLPDNIAKPDLIIVARGGGSIEDLMPFNEEIVIRAVADSAIPVISAVGHETDTTLIDYASDCRAPTPTAAAEIALPVKMELENKVKIYSDRLQFAISNFIQTREAIIAKSEITLSKILERFKEIEIRLLKISTKLQPALIALVSHKVNRLSLISGRLNILTFKKDLARYGESLHNLFQVLISKINNIVDQSAYRLLTAEKLLESYHYKKVLQRGFALVKNPIGNKIISRKENIDSAVMHIEFFDGVVKVKNLYSGTKKMSQENSNQKKLFTND